MQLNIRPAQQPADYPALVAIWRSAVDATHDFLDEQDKTEIESNLVSTYFPAVSLFVAEMDRQPVGFGGMHGESLEMLFVDADQHGRGIGSALLDHAITTHGVTSVDVNVQNTQAVQFYERRGFHVVGRSDTDEAGRPYPLLHLRSSEPSQSHPTATHRE